MDPTSASIIAIPSAVAIDGSADITLAEIRTQVTPAGTRPDDPLALTDRCHREDRRCQCPAVGLGERFSGECPVDLDKAR
jgi:hypothetical protein